MTVTHKVQASVQLLASFVLALRAYAAFENGQIWMLFLWAAIALIMTFLAFHLYKETWEIEEQNRIITIRKNGKVRFQGRRIDITSVSSDWTDYLVSPAKGRTMRIPKKAANDTLLKLIGKVDQPRT